MKDDTFEIHTVKDNLNTSVNEFVEEILQAYYGSLIQFVKECELIIDKGDTSQLKPFESKSFS